VKRLLGYIPFTRWWRQRKAIEYMLSISPISTPFMHIKYGTSLVEDAMKDYRWLLTGVREEEE
jgi:hypothetical protein